MAKSSGESARFLLFFFARLAKPQRLRQEEQSSSTVAQFPRVGEAPAALWYTQHHGGISQNVKRGRLSRQDIGLMRTGSRFQSQKVRNFSKRGPRSGGANSISRDFHSTFVKRKKTKKRRNSLSSFGSKENGKPKMMFANKQMEEIGP